MNEKLIEDFLNKKNVFAVVGASRNPKKYGHQVYKELKEAGYKVYPINPNTTEILGDKCYPKLEELPEKPDIANLVVPPKITEKIVRICKNIGIKKVWMQPGSESKSAISFCQKNNIKVVYGVCVIIQSQHNN